ncbi:unnamed protein product, partial [Musa textilis]
MVNCGERVASFSIEGCQTGRLFAFLFLSVLSGLRGRTFELWKRAFQKMKLTGMRTPHHPFGNLQGTVTVVSIHGNRYKGKR